MAEMEAEAMLVGPWKSFEELEENLNLDELNLIVKASYESEFRRNKFMAALKGVSLPDPKEQEAKTRFERAQMRAQARLAGMSAEEADEEAYTINLASLGWTVSKE